MHTRSLAPRSTIRGALACHGYVTVRAFDVGAATRRVYAVVTMHERIDASHAQRSVSVVEAARLLGIAPSTVRRQIRMGHLEAIREIRPQGSAWRVLLPGGTSDCVSEHRPRAGAATADGASHESPQEETRVNSPATVGATARPTTREHAPLDVLALTALVEALAAAQVLAEQRAETIAQQAERLGYVTAERDTVRAELERLRAPAPSEQPPASEPEPERADTDLRPAALCPAPVELSKNSAPWWRMGAAYWSWLVLLAILALAFAVGQAGAVLRP